MGNLIKFIFLFLYIADVVNTIIAIRLDNRKYYAATKPLLLPLLLATYLSFLPKTLLVATYQKYAIIAMILYFFGDLFLLFPKTKTLLYFYIGSVSFLVGHIFYILWFSQGLWGHNFLIIAVAIAATLALNVQLTKVLLFGDKKMAIAFSVYSVALSVLIISIVSTFKVSVPVYGSLIATVGVCVFWFSDFTIACREMKIKDWGQMVTMSTYISAQTLLALGMLIFQGVL